MVQKRIFPNHDKICNSTAFKLQFNNCETLNSDWLDKSGKKLKTKEKSISDALIQWFIQDS